MGFNNELRAKEFKVFYDASTLNDKSDFLRCYKSADEILGDPTQITEIRTSGMILNNYALEAYRKRLNELVSSLSINPSRLSSFLQRSFNMSSAQAITGSQLIEAYRELMASSLFSSDPFMYQYRLMRKDIYGYHDSGTYFIFKLVANPSLLERDSTQVVSRKIGNAAVV